MASAHTPGPRRTCPCNPLNEHYCHNLPDRLIAAAPRMLAFVHQVENFWPDKVKTHPDVKILLAEARAILRDVEGGSNG